MSRKRRSEGGFSLIEVLIAAAISSAVVFAMYMSFSSVLSAQRAVSAQAERTRQTTRFMETFSREISSSYVSGNRATFFRGKPLSGKRHDSAIEFTAFGYPMPGNAGHGDLTAIRYSVLEGEDGHPALFREAWNPYSRDAARAAARVEVIGAVESFDVTFYNGTAWAAAWDGEFEKGMPQAVLAIIKTIDRGEERETRVLARTMVR